MPAEIFKKYQVELISDQERDDKYYYNLITSKAVVFTYPSAIDPSQINIQLWHGFPLKGMSYMSKSEGPGVEQNHLNWSKLDVIASYSQFYTTLMNACYGVSWRKYVVTGMPRNDFCSRLTDGKYWHRSSNKIFVERKSCFICRHLGGRYMAMRTGVEI